MRAETGCFQRLRLSHGVEVMGFEPTASSMRPKRSSQLSYTPAGRDRLARPPAELVQAVVSITRSERVATLGMAMAAMSTMAPSTMDAHP